MFLCMPCHEKENLCDRWSIHLMSRGKCEDCGTFATCADCATGALRDKLEVASVDETVLQSHAALVGGSVPGDLPGDASSGVVTADSADDDQPTAAGRHTHDHTKFFEFLHNRGFSPTLGGKRLFDWYYTHIYFHHDGNLAKPSDHHLVVTQPELHEFTIKYVNTIHHHHYPSGGSLQHYAPEHGCDHHGPVCRDPECEWRTNGN